MEAYVRHVCGELAESVNVNMSTNYKYNKVDEHGGSIEYPYRLPAR